MKSNQRGAAWPYLIILLGLLALSITAPRAWNRQRSNETPMGELLDEQAEGQSASDAVDVPAHAVGQDKLGSVAPAVDSKWVFSGKAMAPVVVAPLRAFSKQVIDPIVEFARRPTELRTLPDLYFPRFDTAETADPPNAVWAMPTSLLEVLDQLSTNGQTAPWSNQVRRLIGELREPAAEARSTHVILSELASVCEDENLPVLNDPVLRADLLRARYAVVRRLAIWKHVAEQIGVNDGLVNVADADLQAANRVSTCLAQLELLTASVNAGDAWREYLLVDRLRSVNPADDQSAAERRELAMQVLNRLSTQRLSIRQRQFATTPAIASLLKELKSWAAEPVELPRLLAHLERYEQSQLASDARLLAADCRSLRWGGNEFAQQLGEEVDVYYRNANLRIALSPVFVNRFVPQPSATVAPVYDTIQGVPVRGRSTTFTSVSVRAIPDPRRIRLGLEANGIVASNTSSDAGPATFYNKAESSFLVRKLLLVGPQGMRAWQAVADADSYYSDLTDVETSFDVVPLVGPLVRNYARSQHEEVQGEARREVESKVAVRARRQFDEEVQPRIDQLTTRVDREVLEPLRRLGLDPTALDMQTADDRLTVRMRLAGEEQLAAHTPRPRAPSDSLVSVQVHQSALNNLLESLDLAGREFTVPELYRWLGAKLNREIKAPEDVPDDVVVRFADQDPVRVRCVDGRLELAVAFTRLSHGKKRWRNFAMKTAYEPDPSSLEGRLVRTGGIFLEGETLQGRAEFVLRSILSKAFSVERPWRLMPAKYAADPRIADLEITQFVVEDGWIGVAYAPKRVSSEMARRPR